MHLSSRNGCAEDRSDDDARWQRAGEGIASTENFGYSLDALLHEADIATYAAERKGMNQVVVATPHSADRDLKWQDAARSDEPTASGTRTIWGQNPPRSVKVNGVAPISSALGTAFCDDGDISRIRKGASNLRGIFLSCARH
jgi:hypothetical protein